MSFTLREVYIILLSLLHFVKVLSINDCCPKPLDPDAFRNVVSITACDTVLLSFFGVNSIMCFSLFEYVCVLIETSHYKSVNVTTLPVAYSRKIQCRGQVLSVTRAINNESS